MAATEHDLVRQIGMGDVPAFEELAGRYREPIRRHIARTVRDEDAAEDLTQEVLLRLWTHSEQWNGSGSLKAWLFRIAMNLALNYLRTVRRRRQLPLPEERAQSEDEDDEVVPPAVLVDVATLGPEAVVEQAEQRRLLRRLVGTLPEEKQEVLRLVHDAELELREVAAVLGIPEGTVKSRLYYATKRLAHQWREVAQAWEE